MPKSLFLFLFLFLLLPGFLSAQDFNAKVTVNHARVQTTNVQIFRNMELSMMEFLNNRKWAKQTVNPNERIDWNIVVSITDFDNVDRFKATLQLQVTRPVYGTSYSTLLMNHEDPDFNFSYVNFQPMDFSENSYLNNLTSVLAFYAYITLGLDGDSFSLYGGTDYFKQANNVVIAAQNSPEAGWSLNDKNNKNRSTLIDNLTNDRFKQFREAFYIYHRKGLDIMAKDLEAGRSEITRALTLLLKVSKLVPNSFLMKAFFNAKSTEIVNIYSKALTSDKNKVVEMLKEMDPANSVKWDQIKN